MSRWNQTWAFGVSSSVLNSTLTVVGGINSTPIGGNGPADGFFNRTGVGTTTPKARLHVAQVDGQQIEPGLFEATTQHAILRLRANTNGYFPAVFFDEGFGPAATPYIYSGGNAQDIRINVQGVDRILWPANGGTAIKDFLTVNGAQISSGAGAPNGVVAGSPGDMYLNRSGGAGTTLWVKESGAGTNTGWVGK